MYMLSILFQVIFPFRLLQNIEQSSLCYIVGSCRLSILNIAVCIYVNPKSLNRILLFFIPGDLLTKTSFA